MLLPMVLGDLRKSNESARTPLNRGRDNPTDPPLIVALALIVGLRWWRWRKCARKCMVLNVTPRFTLRLHLMRTYEEKARTLRAR